MKLQIPGLRFCSSAVWAAVALASALSLVRHAEWVSPGGHWVIFISGGMFELGREGLPGGFSEYVHKRGGCGWLLGGHDFDLKLWQSPWYRHDATYTRLRIPAWTVLAVLALPTAWSWARVRRAQPGHCTRCGYDLTGNIRGRCPECGAAVHAGRTGVKTVGAGESAVNTR